MKAQVITPTREGKARIELVLGGVSYVLTHDEWIRISNAVAAAFNEQRVKCPTCRCRLTPGEWCLCCAEPGIDLEPGL